jgi:hypothetical protein
LFCPATSLNAASTTTLLYPFGVDQGDIDSLTTSPAGDCNNGWYTVTALPGFPFLDQLKTVLYVSYSEHFCLFNVYESIFLL